MTQVGQSQHITNYRFYRDSPELLSVDDWEKFAASKGDVPRVKLLDGLPQKLEGPLVWSGKSLPQDEYIYILNESEKNLIDKALKKFENSGESLDKVSSKNFELYGFGERLAEISNQIYNGIGFSLIRGLDIEKYNEKQRVIIYLGISSYIGDIRDAQGLNRTLTHIKSIAHIPRDERAIIAVSQQTTDPQMFHNDLGLDIVSLFVLDVPKEGGESLLASTYTTYNELAKTRPDLLNVLAKENGFKYSNLASGDSNLVSYVDNRFISHFSTRSFIGYGETPRSPEVPPLTDEQREAFGAYQYINYQNSIAIKLVKGDIEYLNNFHLQHCRHGYTEDNEHRRHVARLWLRNSKYSDQIILPEAIKKKKDEYFPLVYKQEIPLNVHEEEALKLKANVQNLNSIYAKPK